MLQTINCPVMTDSVTNKPASPSSSLYHTCRSVLNVLESVPEFKPFFETEDEKDSFQDPLNRLWDICRKDGSLCILFNLLRPGTFNLEEKRKTKEWIYRFIVACRDTLDISEQHLFTVSDIFTDDTNRFVKVVYVLRYILDMLEQEGIISTADAMNSHSDQQQSPKNTRDKVVCEFLETERKYVQDLEVLQNYMQEAQSQKVLPPNTLHEIFGNLNTLIDFQRRFLVQVEEAARQLPEDQRFGQLFIQFEESFSVYEPFCANIRIAQDLVVQETPRLQKLADIMSPTFELPSMLIKPVQRVCKYPLLMQQMIKSTPEDWSYYEEMQQGLDAIQRITSKINERKRQQENEAIVENLKRRVENRKVSIDRHGQLLLQDKFMLFRNDRGAEMLVYLFERTLLICKEDKDGGKRNPTISIKKKKKESNLIICGQISVSEIAQVNDATQNGQWALSVFWSETDRGDSSAQGFSLQSLTLKCRNNEQLTQWDSSLQRLIQIEKRRSVEGRMDLQPRHPVHSLSLRSPERVQSRISDTSDVSYEEDEEEGTDEKRVSENDESTHRPHPAASPLSWTSDEYTYANIPMGPVGLSSPRHFNAVPGMTLPPLPRSAKVSATSVDHGDPHGPLTASTSSHASSPTLSYPPTPRRSPTAGPTHRRQDDDNISAADMNDGVSMGTDEDRRQSLLASPVPRTSPASIATQQNGVHMRSQSGPSASPQHRPYPSEKSPARVGAGFGKPLMDDRFPITPPGVEHVKAKIHYLGDTYMSVVPVDIPFKELMVRIRKKIQLCGLEVAPELGLKYLDEDGDMVTIGSDEDLQIGFESRGLHAVSFYLM